MAQIRAHWNNLNAAKPGECSVTDCDDGTVFGNTGLCKPHYNRRRCRTKIIGDIIERWMNEDRCDMEASDIDNLAREIAVRLDTNARRRKR